MTDEEGREEERSAGEMKQLEATAYHEAGHAALYLILGRAFSYVTIEPDEDSSGHCKGVVCRGGKRLEMDVYDGNSRGRDWLERVAMISLAGHAAEHRFTGRDAAVGSRGDFSTAADALSNLCGDSDETTAYLTLMAVRTRNYITRPENWLLVQRLAAALLAERTIRYKAAKEIADQARQDIIRMPRGELERMYAEAEAYIDHQSTKKGAK
jgi:hypothetical protein